MKKKSIVYIDGFNLFYGLLKKEKNRKWLNLQKYFEKLRTDDEIEIIKYFTTRFQVPSAILWLIENIIVTTILKHFFL